MYPVDLFCYLIVLGATNGFAPNANTPAPARPAWGCTNIAEGYSAGGVRRKRLAPKKGGG
jgi:hypothetical protein